MNTVLHAFAGYGIELEYMIVDRQALAVRPIADALLRNAAGEVVAEVERGRLAWSNEMVLHLIELKNARPDADLEALAAAFALEVRTINQRLAPLGACLMPGAAHPWMDPRTETHLWPYAGAPVYAAYDRIFDCKRHGQANLQSMHVNLPFADDAEFARLHAAIRLLLPILPAIAASSPIVDGAPSGWLDTRLEAYRNATRRVPSVVGATIPETVVSRDDYDSKILAPLYRDIAPFDPEGVLRHEWLNCRGAIARFDRNAIEIRVIDLQECPRADLAIAAATVAAVRLIHDTGALREQQEIGTEALVQVLLACIRDADRALIDDAAYLRLLGYPGHRCEARELWRHLIEVARNSAGLDAWREPLTAILDHGPLARRILRAVGADPSRPRQHAVYRQLCECLEAGQMFFGFDR